MLAWFQHLSKREQVIISGGSIFLVLLLFYYLIWSPLSNAVTDASRYYQKEVSLLEYLHQSVPKLLAYQGQFSSNNSTSKNEPLLTRIETSINHTKLATYLTNIEQQDDSIHITFDSVPFDTFIEWMQTFSHQNSMTVDTINVTHLTTPGLVKIILTIK